MTAVLLTSVDGFDSILASWEPSRIKFETVGETLIEAASRRSVAGKTEPMTSYNSQAYHQNNSRFQHNPKFKKNNFRPNGHFKKGDDSKFRPKKGKAAAAAAGTDPEMEDYENANFVSSAYCMSTQANSRRTKRNRKPTRRSQAFKQIEGSSEMSKEVRSEIYSIPNKTRSTEKLICDDSDDPYGEVRQYIDDASSISSSVSNQEKFLKINLSDDEMFDSVEENKQIEVYMPFCFNAHKNVR